MPDVEFPLLADPITANELRALAEASDAIRGEEAWVIENPKHGDANAPRFLVVTKKQAELDHAKPLMRLHTDDLPDMVDRRKIRLTPDRKVVFVNGNALDLNECDAIFTSLSAVEKFVVPYYARLRPLEECERMRRRFATDASAVAFVHLPGSVEDIASLAGGASTTLFVATASEKLGLDDAPLELRSLEEFAAEGIATR